jgi:hypothetical protein
MSGDFLLSRMVLHRRIGVVAADTVVDIRRGVVSLVHDYCTKLDVTCGRQRRCVCRERILVT